MFLHLSVILFTRGGVPLGPGRVHTSLDTPPGYPLDTHILCQQAGGTHPTGIISCLGIFFYGENG